MIKNKVFIILCMLLLVITGSSIHFVNSEKVSAEELLYNYRIEDSFTGTIDSFDIIRFEDKGTIYPVVSLNFYDKSISKIVFGGKVELLPVEVTDKKVGDCLYDRGSDFLLSYTSVINFDFTFSYASSSLVFHSFSLSLYYGDYYSNDSLYLSGANNTYFGDRIMRCNGTDYNLSTYYSYNPDMLGVLPQYYNVNFYDGSNLLYSSSVEENSIVSFVGTLPSREYYDFIGWSLSNNSSEIIDLSTYLITDNTSFYAVFSPIPKFVVNYYNYDNTLLYSENVYRGYYANAPSDVVPYKKGYTFVNWNYDFSLPITADIDIFPNFQINQYKIYIRYNSEIYWTYVGDYGSLVSISQNNFPIIDGYHYSYMTLNGELYENWFVSISDDQDYYIDVYYAPNEYSIRIYDYYNGLYHDDIITYDSNIYEFLQNHDYLSNSFYDNNFILKQRIYYVNDTNGYVPVAIRSKNSDDLVYNILCTGNMICYIEYDVRANITYKYNDVILKTKTYDFIEYDYRWLLNDVFVTPYSESFQLKNDSILIDFITPSQYIVIDNVLLYNDINLFDLDNRLLSIDLSTFLSSYFYNYDFNLEFNFICHYEERLYSITWYYPNVDGSQIDRCITQSNLKYNSILSEPYIDFVSLNLVFVQWNIVVRDGENFTIVNDSGILPTYVDQDYLFMASYFVNDSEIVVEDKNIYDLLKVELWVDGNDYVDEDGNQIDGWLKPLTDFLYNVIMLVPKLMYNFMLWLVFKCPIISDLMNFITGGLLKVFVLNIGYLQQLSVILYIGPLLLSLLLLYFSFRLIL